MSAVLDAWQAALAAEQQAAFGYALLGPRLIDSEQELARTCQSAHEETRDLTAEAIAAAGTAPGAPRGDYPALYAAATNPRALAATLEDQCAAAWRYLYAQASHPLGAAKADPAQPNNASIRKRAQRALIASAVRATRWRMLAGSARPVTAFPGTS